ncbi:transporter [Rhodopseudomonas boonkerdii]|uniref:TolC family outer membrane protein n=1 Tax=Rhodopseudomonas boonkerdii TaxID=475937 RepID=UPI003D31509F|nr:transporter [Rhodopseudomonas boonkerdii]
MTQRTGSVRWCASVCGHALSVAAALAFSAIIAQAETLNDALVKAYQSNPQLNADRARQRATDENVSQAMAGYRPQIAATLGVGLQAVRNLLPDNTVQGATLKPWTIGVTVTQTLFNGFKTSSSVRVAEFQVKSGREALRNVGQGVLLDAVTAYTNVLASASLLDAQRVNVAALRETLDVARKRLASGDVTPTDTAQAEARLARGQADLNAAEVSLAINQATYLQVIGVAPARLAPAEPIDRLLPTSRDNAVAQAASANPAVLAARFDVDTATTTISVAESSLYPTVTVQAGASRSVQSDSTLGTFGTDQASIIGQASVPIYDGGLAAAQTRQAKELAMQSRQVLEQVRNQARSAAIGAWVSHEGSKIAVAAAEAEVKAASVALQGVQREALGGQRTTVDVLNAQQDLIQAKARLIGALRDRVIASYTLLGAVGGLDVRTLALNTPDYLPEVHYHQVRDAWHGLRTPSGK